MSIFDQSFDDLLKEANVQEVASATTTPSTTTDVSFSEQPQKDNKPTEPNPFGAVSFADLAAQATGDNPAQNVEAVNETKEQPVSFDTLVSQEKVENTTQSGADNPFGALSFDELMKQAGVNEPQAVTPDTTIFDAVDTTQQVEEPVASDPKEDLTETFRVDLDVFGENDKPSEAEVETEASTPKVEEAESAETSTPTVEETNTPNDVEPVAEETNTPEDVEPTSEIEQVETVETESSKETATKTKAKPRAKKATPKTAKKDEEDTLLDAETVEHIRQEIRDLVRNEVRNAFKEAISDMANAFK